jgi:hypothetical protein
MSLQKSITESAHKHVAKHENETENVVGRSQLSG